MHNVSVYLDSHAPADRQLVAGQFAASGQLTLHSGESGRRAILEYAAPAQTGKLAGYSWRNAICGIDRHRAGGGMQQAVTATARRTHGGEGGWVGGGDAKEELARAGERHRGSQSGSESSQGEARA